MASRTVVARDGCVVDTEPLADLLGNFVAAWNRRHPPIGGRFSAENSSDIAPVRAVESIAAETRANDPAGIGISEHRIQHVMKRTYPTTELRVADALVAAIDQPSVWHDGTLTIRPNPFASKNAQATCCGGSTST